MAVSLAHMSQEASQRRATTLPSSLQPPPPPPPYVPSQAQTTLTVPGQYHYSVPTPVRQPDQQRHSTVPTYPAANQPWVGIPIAPMSYAPEQRHSYQPGTEYSHSPVTYQQPTRHSYQPPTEFEMHERPALPPRPSKQLQQPPSPRDSVHSSGSASADTAPAWRTSSIEPDPLPPHSNPQALSETQSEAFAESRPIPDVSLGADEIWSTSSGLAEFRITREAAHLPKLISSKPILTVTRTSNGQAIGMIKFHAFTTNNIELLLPSGRNTSISHSGFLHNRWGFQALSSTNTCDRWYWKKDRSTGGAMLENSKHKHGEVLARIKEDRLSFVRPRLRTEEYDEIVLSAIAMAEAARRHKRRSEIGDLGTAVGELTGTDGGS